MVHVSPTIIVAIIGTLLLLIVVILLIVLAKKIRVSIEIMKEASKWGRYIG